MHPAPAKSLRDAVALNLNTEQDSSLSDISALPDIRLGLNLSNSCHNPPLVPPSPISRRRFVHTSQRTASFCEPMVHVCHCAGTDGP